MTSDERIEKKIRESLQAIGADQKNVEEYIQDVQDSGYEGYEEGAMDPQGIQEDFRTYLEFRD